MKKAFCFVSLLIIARLAMAMDSSVSVFYPLPTQLQGKAFAAKSLFLGGDGGIWFQDMQNHVLFFDGQNILPKTGSALSVDSEHIAFVDGEFWSFSGHQVYRSLPNKTRQHVFNLTPGSVIDRIGTSERFIWLSDRDNFYTYHLDTHQMSTYSLVSIDQLSQSSNLVVTAAQFLEPQWVLGTSSGAYFINDGQLEHLVDAGKRSIDTLYFSEQRKELLLGTRHGLVIVSLDSLENSARVMPDSHVLSVTETLTAYWVGTESGLIRYPFVSKEAEYVSKFQSVSSAPLGKKVYSLLNDKRGGVWVATERGVHYFSIFSQHFERFSPSFVQAIGPEQVVKVKRRKNQGGYWMITDSGIYQLQTTPNISHQLFYKGKVNDVLEMGGLVWLATQDEVICIDTQFGRRVAECPPNSIRTLAVEAFAVDKSNGIWGVSTDKIWRYDTVANSLSQYGSQWVQSQYLPAQLTEVLNTQNEELVIGTEHGIYLLQEGQVSFINESQSFGRVLSIVQLKERMLWVAGTYGLYKLDINSLELTPLALVDQHIAPKCLVKNKTGVWLTSSLGLTHYDQFGNIKAHYGEPLGLINNEFKVGLCSTVVDKPYSLFLGSRNNLIRVDTHQLQLDTSPIVSVILSQILVNQNLHSLAGIDYQPLNVEFGQTISFQFGVLPQVNSVSLQYRLTNRQPWQSLEGMTLFIEHIAPGQHQLQVRSIVDGQASDTINRYGFTVEEPWYISTYAIFVYVILLVVMILFVVYLRSMFMLKTNRELRFQVALKTSQLNHQTRILLTNNTQLRKQLEVRQIFYRQSIEQLKAYYQPPHDPEEVKESLNTIVFSRPDRWLNQGATENLDEYLICNLSLLLRSALDGWNEELANSNLSIDVSSSPRQDLYALLKVFNLDVVFNVLIANILCRSQSATFHLKLQDQKVVFTSVDDGQAISELSEFWCEIEGLVKQSDGESQLTYVENRNLVQLFWADGCQLNEKPSQPLAAVKQLGDKPKASWLKKLQHLVDEHYADPDFGTSAAARKMFVSERSFQRRFKSAMQRTFMDYVTEVRLDHACRRLLAGEKVSDVAFECGFNDPSYFGQRFKHRFGVSPSQFIAEQERARELT
ncbi:helix-turn-helix domain-containing protein [Vibrio ostreicida]|uniref:AraC family transcriptional regulator n=1 Tax=Vibrio ostreicida TaxID=526588 RepID=UPI0009FDF421|nr:AraC family transcriptional regulator [Vibrio ostreicida]